MAVLTACGSSGVAALGASDAGSGGDASLLSDPGCPTSKEIKNGPCSIDPSLRCDRSKLSCGTEAYYQCVMGMWKGFGDCPPPQCPKPPNVDCPVAKVGDPCEVCNGGYAGCCNPELVVIACKAGKWAAAGPDDGITAMCPDAGASDAAGE